MTNKALESSWKVSLLWGAVCFMLLSNSIPFDVLTGWGVHQQQAVGYLDIFYGMIFQYLPAVATILAFTYLGTVAEKRGMQIRGIYAFSVSIWLVVFYIVMVALFGYFSYTVYPYEGQAAFTSSEQLDLLMRQLPYFIIESLPVSACIIIVCSYAMLRELKTQSYRVL